MGIKSSLVIPSVVAMWKGGDNITEDRIIVKSEIIPEASADTYKKMYCYSGETNSIYTHGYIYECKGTEELSIPIVYFDPGKMAFDYTKATHPYKTFSSDADAMYKFLSEILQIENPTDVVSGQATVVEDTIVDDHEHYEMWNIYCKDKDGNDVLTDVHKIYANDMQAYGFEFAFPAADYHENEPINFNFEWQKNVTDLHWERIDVQPSSSGGTSDYDDLSNKPSINSVTLSGNKTSTDLGVANVNLGNITENAKLPLTDKLSGIYQTVPYEVVGTPTITNGVVTGFSSTSYIKGPKVPTGTTKIDVVVKFKPTDVNASGAFFHLRNFYFYFSGGTTLTVFIKATDEWKSQVVTFDNSIIDQFAWVHYNTNGTQQTIEISTDGVNFNHTVTLNYTDDTLENENLNLGCRWNGNVPFTGYIDLNDTNVQLEEKYWFIGNSDTVKPAHLAMPSDVYDDLTLGASGAEYTAPADGYFAVSMTNINGTPCFVSLNNMTNGMCNAMQKVDGYTDQLKASFAIKKGDKVKLSYENITSTEVWRFIYAEGATSEQQGA